MGPQRIYLLIQRVNNLNKKKGQNATTSHL